MTPTLPVLRAVTGAAQLGYGVAGVRRSGYGWYHVVLGSRQLLQASLDAGGLPPRVDAAVDGIHVLTMLAVAAARPARRRDHLAGAAQALLWTFADVASARRTRLAPQPPSPSPPSP